MNFIPISMCSFVFLSTSCFATDVLSYDVSRVVGHPSVSRLVEETKGEIDPTGQQARKAEIGDGRVTSISEDEINKCLDSKAALLTTELPKILDILSKITEDLRVKISATRGTNFDRATELATIGSYGFSLHKSASIILQNLIPLKASKEGKVVLNASLAITGSGALKTRIDDFIKILAHSEDTRDINCEMLKESNRIIASVTGDIDFNGLSVS